MKQRSIFLSLSLAMILAACGGEETKNETWLGTPPPDGSTSTAASATETATHPASPGGAALVPEVASGGTVIVVVETNSIAVPKEGIPVGPAVLTVQNVSSDVHVLHVEGPGVQLATAPIAAGQSVNLEPTFQRGTYTFYCSLADHRTNGEQIQINIPQ